MHSEGVEAFGWEHEDEDEREDLGCVLRGESRGEDGDGEAYGDEASAEGSEHLSDQGAGAVVLAADGGEMRGQLWSEEVVETSQSNQYPGYLEDDLAYLRHGILGAK